MTELAADWRSIDGVRTAWFEAPSLTAGAQLATRILEVSTGSAVDLRATGLRVRLDPVDDAAAVSAIAAELGIAADPAAPQQLTVTIESPDPAALQRFWQPVLDYVPADGGGLRDPLRRDPNLRIRPSAESRPLRSRIHLDVVRPGAVAQQVSPGEGTGPYGVRHADPDGNEVDLVAGDPLTEGTGTADWQQVFGAVACYRVSAAQQHELAVAAAGLADADGFPLLVDLRPGLVILDSGKDRWDPDAHGLDVDFADLAARLQTAARDIGATADPTLPRFVQIFLDAADVPAVRNFWVAALGYEPDRRSGVTDIVDPRDLNPVLVFQELDPTETERRRQRNRLQLELVVPADALHDRVATAVAAGGTLLDDTAGRRRIADPEGNELVFEAI